MSNWWTGIVVLILRRNTMSDRPERRSVHPVLQHLLKTFGQKLAPFVMMLTGEGFGGLPFLRPCSPAARPRRAPHRLNSQNRRRCVWVTPLTALLRNRCIYGRCRHQTQGMPLHERLYQPRPRCPPHVIPSARQSGQPSPPRARLLLPRKLSRWVLAFLSGSDPPKR